MKKILMLAIACIFSATIYAEEKVVQLDSIKTVYKNETCGQVAFYICYFHDKDNTVYTFSHSNSLDRGKVYIINIDEPEEALVFENTYYAVLRLRKTPD